MIEDIKTTCGIDTPAAAILWKMIKDDEKTKRRVFKILNEAINFYISLKDIKNLKVRKHAMNLVHKEKKEFANSFEVPEVRTYLINVLTYVYRKNFASACELSMNERRNSPLHASVRRQY